MDAGETDMLLIVPEQYSHDAERRLCAVCGDALSLHGETLSFTRLCGRVFAELGIAARLLDNGGQMLVMHRALESVARSLRVYGTRGMRVELLEELTEAMKEFKSLNFTPDTLEHLAEKASFPLSDKLRDLALIYGAYNALVSTHGGDASDRLSLLADVIGDSTVGVNGHIYFDGFNDFTAQELRVIEELLLKNAEITVCLTCDRSDESEVFELPRKTAQKLCDLANDTGGRFCCARMADGALLPEYSYGHSRVHAPNDRVPPSMVALTEYTGSNAPSAMRAQQNRPLVSRELAFLEANLFGAGSARYPEQCDAISIYSASARYEECEIAAGKVLELVRSGYRWRDIGIMARSWEEYGHICESVFEKHNIPFFSSGKADILSKPPVAMLDAALDIAVSGWEYRPVFRYIKSGLTGIAADECAELENYILKWNIRGSIWLREWTLPPSGYGGAAEEGELARINGYRLSITAPLERLREGVRGVSGADVKLRALYAFLEDIKLAECLSDKAEELLIRGEPRLADEYTQLWDVVVNAMEQVFNILGDTALSASEFRRILTLVLSGYDVGVIPVSLDRVAFGSMAMSRRRGLKCLILMGATDENMPMLAKGGGALSNSEREEISSLGAELPSGLEEQLCREMNMLYSTLTLPSQELILTYPVAEGARPAFIIKRLKAMFGLSEKNDTRGRFCCVRMAAGSLLPVYSYGHSRVHAPNDRVPPSMVALTEYTGSNDPTAMRAQQNRPLVSSRLSPTAAERLYGREISLSPTRVNRYYSCPFQHFMYNGLRLKPRLPAEFDASVAGLFMHFVLEGVSQEIRNTVGFKKADEKTCLELTEKYIGRFVHESLFDFEGRNARFVYLFQRLEHDVKRIVLDMMEELKRSGFEPLDFELDLAELASSGLSGVVDRIDGWEHNGKLYLRVIDYKTGRKSFDLTDIVYGRDMQMLIYLFALKEYGEARYGSEVVPAGVLYVPARDVILKAPRNAADEELGKQRDKELKRGGLILNDPIVIEAMESGDEKRYLPVILAKDGCLTGDSLVDHGQVKLLSDHVSRMLDNAAEGILDGDVVCSPYYKSDNDNACLYCEYRTVCAFDEEAGDVRRYVKKLKNDEIWKQLRVEGRE